MNVTYSSVDMFTIEIFKTLTDPLTSALAIAGWHGVWSWLDWLGVVIPEVQLQRSLTDQEVGSLPDPDGPLSNVLDVYVQSVSLLSEMLQ